MHKVTELFIDNPYLATQIWAELPRQKKQMAILGKY
jgi:hypothetical protein